MGIDHVNLLLTAVSAACWPVCFWWMWHISREQRKLLRQLREQSKRIEDVSREEHQLVKKLHPQVEEIGENVRDIAQR